MRAMVNQQQQKQTDGGSASGKNKGREVMLYPRASLVLLR
jgi:hypothetical protein